MSHLPTPHGSALLLHGIEHQAEELVVSRLKCGTVESGNFSRSGIFPLLASRVDDSSDVHRPRSRDGATNYGNILRHQLVNRIYTARVFRDCVLDGLDADVSCRGALDSISANRPCKPTGRRLVIDAFRRAVAESAEISLLPQSPN